MHLLFARENPQLTYPTVSFCYDLDSPMNDPQTIQTLLLLANLIVVVLAAVLVAVRLRRPNPLAGVGELRADIERLERTIQANDLTSLTNAEGRADALRREVADNINRFADQIAKEVSLLGSAQKAQLETFERTAAAANKLFDERLVRGTETQQKALSEFGATHADQGRSLRDEVAARLSAAADELRLASESNAALQKERLDELAVRLSSLSDAIGAGFEQFRATTEQKLAELRQETSEGLKAMRNDNEQQLEKMRVTVDEKLQGTLEKRLGEQFMQVTQHLKQVHEGLGDMQKLATGVGDLKRVLTNVKSRGTWGETQLMSLLEDMLGPDQYLRNVKIKDGSNEMVEFCIKIPMMDENEQPLLLPVDAKFPIDDYERMMACAEVGDHTGAEQAGLKLEGKIRSSAKDIATKYLLPPRTTEYAVMYVPSEGLYAEIMKRPGVASAITREFNVVLAGPTNLMAILNAVQAVTRSVHIQQKAGHIASLLLKVQSEFVKYGQAVSVARKKAEGTVKAMKSLETRQRVMGKTLRHVKALGDNASSPATALDLISYVDEEAAESDVEADEPSSQDDDAAE